MSQMFALGTEVNHRVGDPGCPACEESYPEPCPCGGLMHATATSDEDADGNAVLATGCDTCGRTEDEVGDV